jgi:hypothetical protein
VICESLIGPFPRELLNRILVADEGCRRRCRDRVSSALHQSSTESCATKGSASTKGLVIWNEAIQNEEQMTVIRARLADAGSCVAALLSLRLHDMLLWMRART